MSSERTVVGDRPVDGPGDVERVLFVFARPLDETLLAGGTIARLAASDSIVTVLTVTDGGVDDTGELDEAMTALGVSDHRILGAEGARIHSSEPRSYSASDPSAEPDAEAVGSSSLLDADSGEVAADIATVVASIGAEAVISYADTGVDGHPDRLAVHVAARHAATVMGVPFYAVGIGPARYGPLRYGGARGGFSVDISSSLPRKRDALVAYGARPIADGVVWPDGEPEALASLEHFDAVDSDSSSDWTDLGVLQRVGAVVGALLLGAVIGGLGTVVYQAGFQIGQWPVPAGLIVSLIVIAAVLAGLRLLLRTRIVAAAAAVGILAVIALLSLESAGGSVLIPVETVSYYWLYGPVLIALLVLAWPALPGRAARNPGVRIAEDQPSQREIETP